MHQIALKIFIDDIHDICMYVYIYTVIYIYVICHTRRARDPRLYPPADLTLFVDGANVGWVKAPFKGFHSPSGATNQQMVHHRNSGFYKHQ